MDQNRKKEGKKSPGPITQTHNLTKTPITALPEFPGGMNALSRYISDRTRYPAEAKANNVSGVVYVSFLVSQAGKVKSPKIIRGLGFGCDKEVLRLLKQYASLESRKV